MTRFVTVAATLALSIAALLAGVLTSAQDTSLYILAADGLHADKVEVPAPRKKHEWLENPDMSEVLKLAQKENRPIFATVRCTPCQQCSWFENALMKPTPELAARLQNFVCAHITTMRDMDARLFRFEQFQDMDCSWWGFFFDPQGRIYGVYGGIDITGDKSRMSVAGLGNAMDRVLKLHYHADRDIWNLFGGAPVLKGKEETPLKHDGWKGWSKVGERADKILKDKAECLHCHEVAEVVRTPRFENKKFDKKTDFYVWPYPENIGLELELDNSRKVKSVIKGGPADRKGIAAGDVVEAANGQLLFSATDLRRVLNTLPSGDAKLELLMRGPDGASMLFTLTLTGEWRKYDLGWRKSVAEADIGAHPGFPWPLKGDKGKAGVKNDELCIKPYFPKGPTGNAGKAGLKTNEQIIAVDGKKPDLHGRAFNAWFRLEYEPGDEITLTVVDDKGDRREIKYKVGRHVDD